MPGLTTHCLFGICTYKKLEEKKLKQLIKSNLSPYALGLQGPDIFFDFLPLLVICRKNIARMIHTQNTGLFFKNFIENVSRLNSHKAKKIASAYLYGFLGHYVLDSATHPMIYYRSDYSGNLKGYMGRHLALETDINTSALEHYLHLKPQEFKVRDSFALSHFEKRVVCRVLSDTINQTYPKTNVSCWLLKYTLECAEVSSGFFYDTRGYRKRNIAALEKIFLGVPFVSPRFTTGSEISTKDPLNLKKEPWVNPWDLKKQSNKSFVELFDHGITDYEQILLSLQNYLAKGTGYNKLLSLIGNKSYHSGLDC